MKIHDDYQALDGAPATAVTIGNFDGVHVGHRALLGRMRAAAARDGLRACALTFSPHPVQLLAPKLAPPLLYGPADKRGALAAEGVEVLLEQRFDQAFAALSPRAFATDVLAGALGARRVVVGYDFTFGARRAGDRRRLTALAAELGFAVEIVSPRAVGAGLVASSSKVREFLLEGRVQAAALVLGRRFHLRGTVARGHGRGRRLGFPTANLAVKIGLVPRVGVYSGWLERLGDEPRAAVINVGYAPTFGEAAAHPTVEAHVLTEAPMDLYGAECRLFFEDRLRDERRFPDLAALRAQIADDRERAHRALSALPPPILPWR